MSIGLSKKIDVLSLDWWRPASSNFCRKRYFPMGSQKMRVTLN